jgi:hypothetical protein
MEAWNKLQTKALLEEKKDILGWLINFRQLLIILPDNKNSKLGWKKSENDFGWLINSKSVGDKHRETSTSRDGHSCHLSFHESTKRPSLYHKTMEISQNQWRTFERLASHARFLKNYKFWNQFEQHCLQTIYPHLLIWLLRSRTWRLQSRRFCLEMVHSGKSQIQSINNLLEHLAAIISPWVDILAGRL